jgi:predicted DCC family thiol-disulfide oxidoreductase YuxK
VNPNNFSLQFGNGLFAGQVFDILGGSFLLLIGAAILQPLAYWRFRGLQVEGEIIGVRRRGACYHGVYRYVLPGGEYCEATSVQSRNSPQGLQTGRRVPIQVMTDKLDEAREQHASLLWALAIGLLLTGTLLVYMGAAVAKRSPIAWVLIVAAVAFVAHWLRLRMNTLLATIPPVARPERWSALPIKPAESLGISPASAPRLSGTGAKSRRATHGCRPSGHSGPLEASASFSYRSDPSVPPFPDDRPIIIFDGHCVLCSRLARFVLRHDRHGVLRLTAAQTPLGQSLFRHLGLDPVHFETNVLLENGTAHFKSDGSIRMMAHLGFPWSLALLARLVPRTLLDRLYDFIAKNRLRWFGSQTECLVAEPSHRDRFLQ